jgi:Zn-finger nucleic acid-binding protein
MKPLKIGDVQVDECPQCRGISFDKGELANAKNEVDPDLRWLDLGIWKQEARFQINDQPLKKRLMTCWPAML